MLHIADSVHREDQPVVGVVRVAREVAVGVGSDTDVAVLVVRVAAREVQSAGVDLLLGASTQVVVAVLHIGRRRAAQGRARRIRHAKRLAPPIVAVQRDQAQARGVHGLAQQLTLEVVHQLREHPVGISHAELLALGIVDVAGDQIQTTGVHRPSEHTVGRVVAQHDLVAIGVGALDQPVGSVVGVAAGAQRRAAGEQVAVFVVTVGAGVTTPVSHALRLPQPIAHGGDTHPLRRGDDHTARDLIVGISGDVAQGIGLRERPSKGIIGRAARGCARILGGDDPPQTVKHLGAGVAVGVHAAAHAPKSVVHSAAHSVYAAGVKHRTGIEPTPVHRDALAQGVCGVYELAASHLVAKGVVAVSGDVAQRVAAGGQRASGVVRVVHNAVYRAVAHRVLDATAQRRVDQPACVGPGQ